MSAILVSFLISFGVQLLKYGIGALYEVRKLRRPNLRDKEGTRVWLENLLRWAAYLQSMFFTDLMTPAFTLGILIELVKPGEKWDAFYAALVHDFNITTDLAPARPDPATLRQERERRVRLLCLRLRGTARMNPAEYGEVTDLERAMADEYLGIARRLLDHPAALEQARKSYQNMTSQP